MKRISKAKLSRAELERMERRMERRMENNPDKLMEFDSWNDLVEYSARKPKISSVSRETDRIDWSGTNTHEDAVKLARNGWHDAGLKAVDISQAYFTQLSEAVKHENYEYDVTGEILDVASFISGTPEYWLSPVESTETVPSENEIIKVVLNGFFSGGINHEAIKARGAVIVALIQLLEHSGKRVKLIYHVPFWNKKQFRATVKEAGEELDVSRLMFVCAHPAMFRRIAFGLYEQHPSEFEAGYGSPHELDDTDKGDIYIPHMSSLDISWSDAKTAQNWILGELKRQGIKLS